MVNILSKQIEALEPDYAAIAHDLKAPTFRHRMRMRIRQGAVQCRMSWHSRCRFRGTFAAMLGLHILSHEGYEADDILGTLARMAEESGDCTAYPDRTGRVAAYQSACPCPAGGQQRDH